MGAAKYVVPAIGKYLTEVGILSQKGVPAYIRSTQVGLGKREKSMSIRIRCEIIHFHLSQKRG